jgi:hypothetical protein
MKIAEEIIVDIAGEAIELHPSLRCAIRLERRPGSFRTLVQHINEGSLSAALDIIGPHTDLPFLQNKVFDVLDTLRVPLLSYVMACAGIDPDDAPSEGKASKAKSVPFSEHLTGLYRIGTGWLGWSPEDTLDATPTEIMEAYRGRTEMLKAIFGGGEKGKPAKDDRPLDQKFRSIFAGHQIIKEGE